MTKIITRIQLLASLAAVSVGMLMPVAASAAATTTSAKSSGLAAALLAARHARVVADAPAVTDFYAKALALDPGNTSLLQRSYSAAASAGNMDTAIAAAKKYYEAEKEPLPMAGLLLATGHFAKKEYDQAWPYIDRIKPDSYLGFALPMIRAWALAARNNPDGALAELAPLQSTKELGELFYIMSGLLNETLGRPQDALIQYDLLASRIERQPLSVLRIVTSGYHRLGKSSAAKELVAQYAQARGGNVNFYGIIDSFTDATRYSKKLTPVDGMAEAYFAISQLLTQSNSNGLGDVATAFGQMAIYLQPDLPMGRWILGSTIATRQRFDDSNAVLGLVRKTDPTYLASQMQMVDNFSAMNRIGDALARLQAISREYPALAEIQMAVGNLLRRDQKFTEAIGAYDKAEQLAKKETEENWSLYYGRGIAFERTKQWPRAESDFKRALELNPDQPDVLNYLGYSWIDRGENLKEGRRLIELAYSKSPENGFIIDSLGWAMYLAGEYQNAATYLEKAVALEPADPTLNEHLGDVYWKVGRKNEARFQWRRALTLKPDDKQKATLQAKLEQGLARN